MSGGTRILMFFSEHTTECQIIEIAAFAKVCDIFHTLARIYGFDNFDLIHQGLRLQKHMRLDDTEISFQEPIFIILK